MYNVNYGSFLKKRFTKILQAGGWKKGFEIVRRTIKKMKKEKMKDEDFSSQKRQKGTSIISIPSASWPGPYRWGANERGGKEPEMIQYSLSAFVTLKMKANEHKKKDLPPFAQKLIGRLEKYEGMLLHKIMVQDCWEDRYKSYTRSSSVSHGTQSRLMPPRYGLPTIGGNQRRRSPNIRECGEHRAHSWDM
jgi:hypothetical protein